jgi:hypothetical protein
MCVIDNGLQRVLRLASLEVKLCSPEHRPKAFVVDAFCLEPCPARRRNGELESGETGTFPFLLSLGGGFNEARAGDEIGRVGGPNILEPLSSCINYFIMSSVSWGFLHL